ncbi:rhomboid family intramembrane serine protease [Skermania piniformis]|uniref:Rhomboid family intramembrane serine protease n=1 Tax=Skermania pinensis TaxID=39122 RepID=A0ABX8SBF1_9ACTN|nr:rhomboid family intramembrane serine protease [Skermania piniformis]QXQ14786.1 rhomboid family intramembrane serine protease [Skermania piniformis]
MTGALRPRGPADPVTPRRSGWTWRPAALVALGFVALLWLVEIADVASGEQLETNGVHPRSTDGLEGILFAPLLHDDWAHLIANTVPALLLGFLTFAHGVGRGFAATGLIWLLGGLGTWLTGGSYSNHIGASVLVFGWLTYVMARGLFNRNAGQLLIGVVVGVCYGAMLWGVLPSRPDVSWQGHLFGALGGLLAAWLFSSRGTVARPG